MLYLTTFERPRSSAACTAHPACQVVGAVRSSFPGAVIILDNTALGPLISRPLQKTASEAVDILIEGPSTAGATTDSDFGCLVLRKPVPADTVDIVRGPSLFKAFPVALPCSSPVCGLMVWLAFPATTG
eukprot:SAG31_NODE_740_length_12438_cov_10.788719_3_plen_129_part_00